MMFALEKHTFVKRKSVKAISSASYCIKILTAFTCAIIVFAACAPKKHSCPAYDRTENPTEH